MTTTFAQNSASVDSASSLSILRLLDTPGVGWSRVRRLLDWSAQHGLSIEQAVEDPGALRQTLSFEQAEVVRSNGDVAARLVDGLAERSARLVAITDEAYPSRLKQLLGKKAPPLLTTMGNTDLFQSTGVGFCGSRKATERGIGTAVDCAEQLARASINVVSGYAAGLDVAAHAAALTAGGTTTIVLAEGMLHFRIKKDLQPDWDWNRTLVVSEFMPSAKWTVGNAMQRNSTICALSGAMILIEAGLEGGSIDAGRAALRLGLPLFAPVYEGMPDEARGNQEMLRQGALPLLKSRHTCRANITTVLDALSAMRRPSSAGCGVDQPAMPRQLRIAD